MAGLVPGIHVECRENVDGRDEPGHDDMKITLGNGLSHPHRAHHEGGDVIAHALLLAARRLRRVALRPLGGSAVHTGLLFRSP